MGHAFIGKTIEKKDMKIPAAALASLLLHPAPPPTVAGFEGKPATETTDGLASLFALPATPANSVRLAHAILVKANPPQEASLTDAPEEVLLIFNDAVGQEFLALAVIDPTGKRVDNHDAKLDFTDHSHLRASVSKLTPGRYTVRYRVLSADGHVVSGKYFFDLQGK